MALTDYELTPTARRVLNLFLMIDTSGSMDGEKIAAVNDAIRNVLPIVSTISDDNPDAEIKIAALTFANSHSWVNPKPVEVCDFNWTDQTAEGWTCMGDAIRELNRQLSHKHGFLTSASGSFAPVVIMLSDGAPTDDFNGAMTDIMSNNWFRHSTKIAIAIGSDADVDVLKTFTGNSELVFRVQNIDALKAVIKATVVTSSMVASRSSSVGVAAVPGTSASAASTVLPTKADMVAASVATEIEGTGGISVGDEELINALDFDEFD